MATQNFEAMQFEVAHCAEYGNTFTAIFQFTTTAGAAAGDKIYFGKLPKGARIVEGRIVNELTSAATTFDLGYEYICSDETDDLDAFLDGYDNSVSDGNTSGVFIQNTGVPVTLLDEAYVVGTNLGATDANETDYTIVIEYTAPGVGV